MQLNFSKKLQSEITIERWRRAQYAAARLMLGLAIACVVGSHIIGALVGGA